MLTKWKFIAILAQTKIYEEKRKRDLDVIKTRFQLIHEIRVKKLIFIFHQYFLFCLKKFHFKKLKKLQY